MDNKIVDLREAKLNQFYEIQNLESNYNFWRRNFFLQLFFMFAYFYLTASPISIE